MGEYAGIHGLIHNITENEVKNYFSRRYGGPVATFDFKRQGKSLYLEPGFHIAMMHQKGSDVLLNGCVKYGTYEGGMKNDMSFFMISDICKALGDSEIRSSAISNLVEDEIFEQCTLRAKYEKRQRPDLKTVNESAYSGTKRLYMYYAYNVENWKFQYDKSPQEGVPYNKDAVPGMMYRQAGDFFRSRKAEDIKAFYNICQLGYWCMIKEKRAILKDFSIEDFLSFLPTLSHGKLFLRAVVTREDMEGFAKIFEHVGNNGLAEYCRQTFNVVTKVNEICDKLYERKFWADRTAIGDAFTQEGVRFEVKVYRDVYWGKNYHCQRVTFTIIVDDSGVRYKEGEEFSLEGLEYPTTAKIMGYYVDDERVKELMYGKDADEVAKKLVDHTHRSKYPGLASALPELIDEKMIYNKQKRLEIARNFAEKTMYVRLNVRYEEKERAKAAGAVWNKEIKAWTMRKDMLEQKADPKWIIK